jgi:hypothetical protein
VGHGKGGCAVNVGLHYGLPAKAYHADPADAPSLSSTIARKLLTESPAHAFLAHPRLGGGDHESTESMGLGSLVHSLMDDNEDKDWVLGPFDSYKGGEARAWRDATALAGKLPVLQRDLSDASPIADALRSKVSLPATKSEVTAVWKDGDVWCRARYDRLALTATSASVWDWKTSSSDLSDRGIIRTIAKYGYHIQVAHYLRGLAAVTGLPKSAVEMTLVFVSVTAPYTVRQVRLSDTFLGEGYRKADEAIAMWAECLASQDWSDPREAGVFEAEMPAYMEEDEIEISV